MPDLNDPELMTLEDLKAELRELGIALKGNPSRKTLAERLAKARAGEPVTEDNPADEKPADGPTQFFKTIPVQNFTLVLKPAKDLRDADGKTYGMDRGSRVKFDENGRFFTSDPVLIERLKASSAYMNQDARLRIEIWNPAAKAAELRAAADQLAQS